MASPSSPDSASWTCVRQGEVAQEEGAQWEGAQWEGVQWEGGCGAGGLVGGLWSKAKRRER